MVVGSIQARGVDILGPMGIREFPILHKFELLPSSNLLTYFLTFCFSFPKFNRIEQIKGLADSKFFYLQL